MTSYLLDASAVLAMLHAEEGGDAVAALLVDAAITTVNWSEVVQKAQAHGVSTDGLRADLQSLGVELVVFEADHAEGAAHLWRDGARHLSLADRACLATAQIGGMTPVTADRRWLEVVPGVAVRTIR